MKSLHRNKKGVSAAGLTELDYSVLNYEELLAVNGAGGSSGGGASGGPSSSSSSSSGTPIPIPDAYTSETNNNSLNIVLPEYHAENQNGFNIGSEGISYTSGNITVYGSADVSGSYSSEEQGNGVSVSTNNGSLISASVSTPLGTVTGNVNSVTVGVEIRF